MATYQEIEELLNKLNESAKEARQTVSELHSARKDALAFFKREREAITNLILTAISEQIVVISEDAQSDMRKQITQVIDRIEDDWRKKLGLDPILR